MGKKQSLRSKATHFVSVLLNPISDTDSHTHNNKPSKHPPPPPPSEEVGELKISESEITDEKERSHDLVEGPDTSSFTAFPYSLLSSSDSGDNAKKNDDKAAADNPLPGSSVKENGGKKSLFSGNKQSLGRAIRQAARIGGFRYQDRQDNSEMKLDDGHVSKFSGVDMRHVEPVKESVPVPLVDLPEISEPSMLLSDSIRNALYASLPTLIHGRKWLLLYSTWRHGISLSSLCRRSMLWPGLSLLVVGDRKGAVFGGLVEAPLRPSNRKYQNLYREQTIHLFSQIPLVILLYIVQQG